MAHPPTHTHTRAQAHFYQLETEDSVSPKSAAARLFPKFQYWRQCIACPDCSGEPPGEPSAPFFL